MANEVATGVVKYWAEWEFSMPGLARVVVIGETPTTFTIGEATNLIGNVYFGATNKKGDSSGLLTDSIEAACEWIEQVAMLRVTRAENALQLAKETVADVQHKIERVKANEVQEVQS